MGHSVTRLEGWESRLVAVLEAADEQPYRLGTHDCLRMSCRAVEALTGVDLWSQFCGYTTQREALQVIAHHGKTLRDAVSKVLDVEVRPTLQARRGDIVLFHDGRQHHLGVCAGALVATLMDDGVLYIPLDHAGMLNCWWIG